jgi:hypothetical protein
MKNLSNSIITLFIALAIVAFGGCSLLEQDIDTQLEDTKLVNETTEGQNIQYSDEITLDATKDEDIRKNLDKIKNWNVVKVSYSLSGFTGTDGTTFSGTVTVRPQSGSASVDTNVSNLDLKALSDSGEIRALGFSETELAEIAKWFEEEQIVIVKYAGTLSQGPTSFYLTVYIDLEVKAKVL